MKREELAEQLRSTYTPARGYGVTKVEKPGYENIWFVVPPSPPDSIPAGLEAGPIGRANTILRARPSPTKATELEQLASYLFAHREAVASSRMEGTWSTIDHALTPSGIYDDDEGHTEHIAVRGYARALDHGLEQISAKGIKALNNTLLCALHQLTMEKDPGFQGVAGRLRAPGLPGDIVQIDAFGRKEDSIYNPTPPTLVEQNLAQVLSWMTDETLIELGDAGMGFSLPLRMAIGHAHFEAVHPFPDGNGRTGRLILPLQIAAAGHLPLYLSGYIEERRAAYSAALQAAQKKLSYREIVTFICEAIIASHDEEKITLDALISLPALWKKRAHSRKNSAASRAMDILTGTPVMTARTLEKKLQTSFQTASSALGKLSAAGVLRERTGKGKDRIFVAEEVIAILARPFAQDLDIALEGARRKLGLSDS